MKKSLKTALAIMFCVVTIFSTMLMASALDKPTVKVKSVTYNSVSLYWTAVSGADYYQIQRTTDGKNWTTLSSNFAKTSCTDSKSLTTGKSYGYRVRAVDKGLLGKLTYSAWTGMVVAKPVPAQVTGLKVKASNNTTVQLTWNKVTGATGYTVQYLNGSAWKTYKSTTGNVLNVTGLTLGKTYSFRVAAYRTVSGKAVYGPVSATLKAGATLNAPTTVALTALNATQLKIQWNAATGAKGYEIYNAATGKWTSTGATRGIIISNLTPGTKYSFKVRAYSGSFKGTESKVYTFQTAPAAPTGLQVTDATDKTISISWNKVEGAAGYQYQYYDSSTKKWIAPITVTSTNATVTGLKGNTTYTFKVRAFVKNSNVYKISATANGAYSATLATSTVLPAPTLKAAGADERTVKLTWNAVSGATAYTLERFDPTRGEWFVYDFTANKWRDYEDLGETSVTTTTELSFSDAGASARAELYRVRAIDANGRIGTASNEICGFTSNVYVGYGVATFNLQQVVRFPKMDGAVTYRVYTRYPSTAVYVDLPASSLTVYKTNYLEAKLCLAPESIHCLMIIGLDSKGGSIGSVTMNFKIGALPMYASSHAYYKSSVNSQLLYLARAINNTKAYKGELTMKNVSQVSYAINSLKILVNGKELPKLINDWIWSLIDSEEMEMESSETYTTNLVFNNGTAQNEEGRTVTLNSQVEPSSKTAYLYNSQNYKAWPNFIENVKTVKNADGGYTISFTIKQETTNANYHNGFLSSFNAKDFGADGSFTVQNLKIGKSTINATIGPDGILKTYKASSPFSADFTASFIAEDSSSEMGVQAGDTIGMKMSLSGGTVFNYTFTK